jgi:hypothetical protein
LDSSYELQAQVPETLAAVQEVETNTHTRTSTPVAAPAPAPAPAPEEQLTTRLPRINHISATLGPRALAAFLKDVDFTQGGDERLPLHTFSANWGEDDEATKERDVEYEFIYEGEFGITWPLRRIRVDGMPVEHEYDEDDVSKIHEAADRANEERGAAVDIYGVIDRHDSKGNVAFHEVTDQPRKFRVRVRNSGEVAPRFKLRARAPEEVRNESMRRLPRREKAMVFSIPSAVVKEEGKAKRSGENERIDGDAEMDQRGNDAVRVQNNVEQMRKDSAGVQAQILF